MRVMIIILVGMIGSSALDTGGNTTAPVMNKVNLQAFDIFDLVKGATKVIKNVQRVANIPNYVNLAECVLPNIGVSSANLNKLLSCGVDYADSQTAGLASQALNNIGLLSSAQMQMTLQCYRVTGSTNRMNYSYRGASSIYPTANYFESTSYTVDNTLNGGRHAFALSTAQAVNIGSSGSRNNLLFPSIVNLVSSAQATGTITSNGLDVYYKRIYMVDVAPGNYHIPNDWWICLLLQDYTQLQLSLTSGGGTGGGAGGGGTGGGSTGTSGTTCYDVRSYTGCKVIGALGSGDCYNLTINGHWSCFTKGHLIELNGDYHNIHELMIKGYDVKMGKSDHLGYCETPNFKMMNPSFNITSYSAIKPERLMELTRFIPEWVMSKLASIMI